MIIFNPFLGFILTKCKNLHPTSRTQEPLELNVHPSVATLRNPKATGTGTVDAQIPWRPETPGPPLPNPKPLNPKPLNP